eukprot:gene7061-8533_t
MTGPAAGSAKCARSAPRHALVAPSAPRASTMRAAAHPKWRQEL